MSHFGLAPLPYPYTALEPFISAETLQFHHDKHQQTYVTKLNELLADSPLANASLDEIVLQSSGPLFNSAGQHWNHDFYWKSLAAASERSATGPVLKALQKTFGSLDAFQATFEKQAVALFGSGWIWLVLDQKGELQIVQTKDADNPLRQDLIPLFTCDVWEHAYYIDYRNARPQYLSNFWNILNWEFVEANYTRGLAQLYQTRSAASAAG